MSPGLRGGYILCHFLLVRMQDRSGVNLYPSGSVFIHSLIIFKNYNKDKNLKTLLISIKYKLKPQNL